MNYFQEGVFPDSSNKSPIAEALRNSLATETWARPGLGLPVKERNVDTTLPAGLPSGPPQLTSTPAPAKSSNTVFPSESKDTSLTLQSPHPSSYPSSHPSAHSSSHPSAHPLSSEPMRSTPLSAMQPTKKPDHIPVGVVAPVTGLF